MDIIIKAGRHVRLCNRKVLKVRRRGKYRHSNEYFMRAGCTTQSQERRKQLRDTKIVL
jgi:hypothetical protein